MLDLFMVIWNMAFMSFDAYVVKYDLNNGHPNLALIMMCFFILQAICFIQSLINLFE
jgi:hypothetical protein